MRWHQNKQNLFTGINYVLSTILAAYKVLEKHIELVATRNQNKNIRISRFAEERIIPFTKADIRKTCFDINEAIINRVLRELRDKSLISPSGLGMNSNGRKYDATYTDFLTLK